MGKSTISMAIFNSYFDITRGYQVVHSWRVVCPELSRQDLARCLHPETHPGAQRQASCESIPQKRDAQLDDRLKYVVHCGVIMSQNYLCLCGQ